MKKRKIYEISVIDKTYSKTISDETKFYTSDTALELVFKLKETEYTFESAEIVLLNIDDRSLVTRPVVKVLDSFTYELEDDIIAHYGEWRGQVRFEQAGETYVSSPVKFRIENDLSNERPPQLSDVQSWVSLKRYADKLTDELKQAVLSIEGIEDTFNENELARQTTFETAEQSRQMTFEANEDIRQTQELEREKAEIQRQQAETQRATAETSRASAEEQRKADHANRSAELASKADKVVIKNVETNGNFSEGTDTLATGFYPQENTTNIRLVDGVQFWTGSTMSHSGSLVAQNIYLNAGDMYYVSFLANNVWGIYVNTTSISMNEDGLQSTTFVLDSYGRFISFRVREINQESSISKLQVINLTQTFGSGNEPTKEEMDELIKVTGYIDGEYALNNKEMLIWTLSLIRQNKNAIIALGGTI